MSSALLTWPTWRPTSMACRMSSSSPSSSSPSSAALLSLDEFHFDLLGAHLFVFVVVGVIVVAEFDLRVVVAHLDAVLLIMMHLCFGGPRGLASARLPSGGQQLVCRFAEEQQGDANLKPQLFVDCF